MKRREHVDEIRFLTFSCNHRLPLFGNPAIRDRFVRMLAQVAASENWRMIAWVVMPEHVHLLTRPAPGTASLVRGLWMLKHDFARDVIQRWRELNAPVLPRIMSPLGHPRFWLPGGGYDRNIWSHEELSEKIAYIHHNPLKRGLVLRPEGWPWSSARWYLGDLTSPVSVTRWGDEPREKLLRSLAADTTAPRENKKEQ